MNSFKNVFMCVLLLGASFCLAADQQQKNSDLIFLGVEGTVYNQGISTSVRGCIMVYRKPAIKDPSGYWAQSVLPQLKNFESIMTDAERYDLYNRYLQKVSEWQKERDTALRAERIVESQENLATARTQWLTAKSEEIERAAAANLVKAEKAAGYNLFEVLRAQAKKHGKQERN